MITNVVSKKPAIYSGEGRSGICICGHFCEDHHLGVILNEDYLQPRSNGIVETYLPGECEYFGFNEMGGLDSEGKEHCFKYRDSMLPDEHN